MVPSVAEIPEVAPTPITVAVKAVLENPEAATEAAVEAKPRVRRIIDEEGGKTAATVCHAVYFVSSKATLMLIVPSLPPCLGPRREVSAP
jgi:hypothetical protein